MYRIISKKREGKCSYCNDKHPKITDIPEGYISCECIWCGIGIEYIKKAEVIR